MRILQRAHAPVGAVLHLPRHGLPGEGLEAAGGGPDGAGTLAASAAAACSDEEHITAVLPLPQDESLWENLHLVFATAAGNVRRNRLSDFRNVRSSGLIAMKLDEGDEPDRRADLPRGRRRHAGHPPWPRIRFTADERHAAGLRGARYRRACAASGCAEGDEVIALSVLRHVEATAGGARRLSEAGCREASAAAGRPARATSRTAAMPPRRGGDGGGASPFRRSGSRSWRRSEEFLLVVTDAGFGKRASAYEYRVTGAAGRASPTSRSAAGTGRAVVATFPVRPGDDVMLVTDNGRLIRLPASTRCASPGGTRHGRDAAPAG